MILMKRYFSILSLCLGMTPAFAQIVGDGYYRVMNQGTNRYVYVLDNSGSIDYLNQSADMGAIELWRDCETKNRLTDPATVIYYDQMQVSDDETEQTGDLSVQGTSVHGIIGYYVHIKGSNAANTYQVYASSKGVTLYLDDETTTTRKDEGVVGTNRSGVYRMWKVYPLNDTEEYLAIEPTVAAGGKYYAPYYVSFPFNFYSEGMKAYYISRIDKEHGLAIKAEVTGTVPAAAPVFVECASADYTNNRITPVATPTTSYSLPSANVLKGVYFSNAYRSKSSDSKTKYDKNTMRVLGLTSEGKLGFVTATAEQLNYFSNLVGTVADPYYLKANQAYLTVESGSPAEFTIVDEDEYSEMVGIESILSDTGEAAVVGIYAPNGARLAVPAQGINIVKYANGTVRKVYVK